MTTTNTATANTDPRVYCDRCDLYRHGLDEGVACPNCGRPMGPDPATAWTPPTFNEVADEVHNMVAYEDLGSWMADTDRDCLVNELASMWIYVHGRVEPDLMVVYGWAVDLLEEKAAAIRRAYNVAVRDGDRAAAVEAAIKTGCAVETVRGYFRRVATRAAMGYRGRDVLDAV